MKRENGNLEKEIALSLIETPKLDLRYYRSREFFSMFCEDIRQSGMLVKPIVQKLPNGHFRLVDGQNRIRCAKKLKWKTVLCDVLPYQKNNAETIIMGLKVNLNRASHDVMGVAIAFKRLHEMGLKQKEIAKRFGMSRGQLSKLVALTNLDSENKLKLAKGELTIPQAYGLVRKRRNPEEMERLGIKYRCDTCQSRVEFRSVELTQICSDCKTKLMNLVRSEKLKLKHEQSQRELA